jgi:hypothetical protein
VKILRKIKYRLHCWYQGHIPSVSSPSG